MIIEELARQIAKTLDDVPHSVDCLTERDGNEACTCDRAARQGLRIAEAVTRFYETETGEDLDGEEFLRFLGGGRE